MGVLTRSFALLVPLVVVVPASAGTVTLAWDPPVGFLVAGYKLYYGPAAGNYPTKIDVGNVTTYIVSNLEEGATYHFAATDYDASGAESGFSNDVAATIPYSPPGTPYPTNYQGLWWNAPANSESGWGINLAHQADTIFASWFTYDTNGRGWWLVMTAEKTGSNRYEGDLLETTGPPFNAVPFEPFLIKPSVGKGILTFSDVDNGNFDYTVNGFHQLKPITRQEFGPQPTCAFGALSDPALAANYQDLWWNAPANSEPGWGINFSHQGDEIFATWFTYDIDGAPMWLVVYAPRTAPAVYEGDLLRTSGPRFDIFNSKDLAQTTVGRATFTFADGNHATFEYTVQVAGMPQPVSQMKTITREILTAPGTTCR